MKGIVFTEFLDFVAARHGAEAVDDVIDEADLPHGGAYTSVGTYPFPEMQRLVVALCGRTGVDAAGVLRSFGGHLCARFAVKYPDFFEHCENLFDFLESVDRHIHVEVNKLYPDAELPRFRTVSRGADHLAIDYESCRPLEHLAEGMIQAAAAHFHEPITISRERMAAGTQPFTRFHIGRAA